LYPEKILDLLVEISYLQKSKMYLLIDEYDNFLNEILVNYGETTYERITHGDGFIRDFLRK